MEMSYSHYAENLGYIDVLKPPKRNEWNLVL